jgi:hypothetical protein
MQHFIPHLCRVIQIKALLAMLVHKWCKPLRSTHTVLRHCVLHVCCPLFTHSQQETSLRSSLSAWRASRLVDVNRIFWQHKTLMCNKNWALKPPTHSGLTRTATDRLRCFHPKSHRIAHGIRPRITREFASLTSEGGCGFHAHTDTFFGLPQYSVHRQKKTCCLFCWWCLVLSI